MARDVLVDTSEVNAGLTAIMRNTPWIIDRVLRELLMRMRRMAKEIVPVDTGHLRASIRFRVNRGTGVIYAYTRWAEMDRDYAAIVHEDLQQPHKHGEAKYIEKPVMVIGVGELAKEIAGAILRQMPKSLNMPGYKLQVDTMPLEVV